MMEQMWPLVVSILITLLCLFYLWEIARSHGRTRRVFKMPSSVTTVDGGIEGFDGGSVTDTSAATPTGGSGSSGVTVRSDTDCYDSFYCRAYDILVQPSARVGMEIKVPIEFMTETQQKDLTTLRVVDIGSGTGNHVELFAKEGVASVRGIDKSSAMVAEARKRYPDRDFIEGDAAATPGLLESGSVDLLTMYYFTIYMIPDRAALLKNIHSWLAPGGVFVCHIVNKLKFDPVLESASPFVGFSVQKYATEGGGERITKSEVAFEEFDYVGDFQLHGSRGLWEEEFRFKNGRVRRHEQRVWMPNIDVLVKEITDAGLRLVHHADMTPIGYEYQYLFFFVKDG